ncbi:adenosylmethionine decarboxylase [Enterococcus sp. BWR-S5]|uniref:adenosylmethionine decarboxylase n=1 Tax=Enterococcus sp. BWR-S5 TaxID=2787714 RepID=UPI0019221C27|nr:adenosylmethionine decarboxylase [Enterococcus sp. BWR-S5]MBL1223617.1 adenosylmethionine decarboxylase [Enterococcus sp. BWR-S5]
MNIAKKIKKQTNLRESEEVIEILLIELYLRHRLSTRCMADRVNLPLPVVSAIRKELKRAGLVTEQQGAVLTRRGRLYVEQQLGWLAIDSEKYLRLLDSTLEKEALKNELVQELEAAISNRPVVEVAYDQAFATLETIVDRAFLLLTDCTFPKKHILFLGDDDLTSLAVGLLVKKIQRRAIEESIRLTVYELSAGIIDCIETTAEKLGLVICCEQVDFRQGSCKWFNHQFDSIFVDPPYTLSGLKLFLSRAVSSSKLGNSKIYLSFGERDPESQLATQHLFSQQNLLIDQIRPKFNHYSGASIINGVSTLYELSTQADSYANILAEKPYLELMYTGELNPRNTVYRCQNCQQTYIIGAKQTFKTIEYLKAQCCSACGSDNFLRVSREAAAATVSHEKWYLGDHYLIELKSCPQELLASVSTVEQTMLAIVETCDLAAVTHYFHQFEPWGVSGVVVLKESHFTIHTWPEENYAAVDLFVCQELSSKEQFISLVTDLFGAGEMVYQMVKRGERMG